MLALFILMVTIYCGACAVRCFNNGYEKFGWINLFFSALNFANFLNIVI
jgi:hypothetical protein